MLKIKENNKIKFIWTRVLEQSEGDKDQAESCIYKA